MKIIKLGKKSCVPCKMVSDYLQKSNVLFEDIDIETTDNFDLILNNNIKNVPTVLLISKEGVVKTRVVGFDRPSLQFLINEYNNA